MPSQSPSVTAPPKGEPRHTPTPALERSCLSPRERWRRVALTERGRRRTPKAFENVPAVAMPSQSPSVTAPPKGEPRQTPTPASEPSCLSPRERWQRVALTKRGRRRTPKAFENVPAVAMPSQSPAVTAPPKGEPRQNRTRIRAFLPLPMGEVAMPQGIDGEGRRGDNPHPIVHCPLSIIHY